VIDAGPTLSRVWEPFQLGPLALKHRIVMTPHGVGWDGSNIPGDRHVAYWSERARGGCALVQVGATPVHQRGTPSAGGPSVASDPRVIPRYRKMADAVHGYDAKVFVELAEGGVHNRSRSATGEWFPTQGVSQLPSVTHNDIPEVLDVEAIQAIQADYAKATGNLQEAGIDGATLHAAHSYLLGQFLSPAYNLRSDAYGGSAQNRVRFLIETAEQVRARVGRGFVLGVRLSYDEYIGDAGITPELSDEYVRLLADTGLFDFFDISTGGYHSGQRFVPPNVLPTPHIAQYAKRARDIIAGRAAVVMAHRVRTIDIAERVLAEGVTDLVAMTRAHMADPFLVTKAREGRFTEIQRCVGTNECVYNSHMKFNHSCTVNPVNGREAKWGAGTLDLAATSRRIAVVGGGPAGLRCATTAAKRGHQVELFEQADRLGGHLNDLASVPFHGTWDDFIEDLTSAAEAAGVKILLGQRVEARSLAEAGYDAVVVATGSTWDREGLTPARPGRSIPGLDTHPRVVTISEAIDSMRTNVTALGANVLVIDETGAYLPLGVAERLLQADVAVTVATRRNVVGEIPRETWEFPLFMERTKGLPLTLHANTIVDRVDGRAVSLVNLWDSPVDTHDFDCIVLSGIRFSNDALVGELQQAGIETHRIGDARAPRRTADAIYEGEHLARTL
jgi:2,4-dienoyl-CoA reductase-like NADH-dependent reductase (Old Yellow Enzyme family)